MSETSSSPREGLLEKGLGKLLKKAVSGEGTRLTKAEGQGRLYLAILANESASEPQS